ncbi:MAG: phage replisome organizer N-terminal domain-containing protein [Alkaliphilus sp.]
MLGVLRFSDTIPYNEKMLATVTNTNVDIVRSAIKIFISLNLVEIMDNGTIFMNEVNKMIGEETAWANKKREYRKRIKKQEKQGQVEDNVQTKKDNVRQEIEKDIDIYNNLSIYPSNSYSISKKKMIE